MLQCRTLLDQVIKLRNMARIKQPLSVADVDSSDGDALARLQTASFVTRYR